MEDRKQSFVLHLDMLEDIKEMTETEKAHFLDFVVNYNLGLVNLDDIEAGATKRYYRLFAHQFDRDHDKWLKTKEKRREAGKKGGLAKASKCYDDLASASDAKHNVNVNVNVNKNINGNIPSGTLPEEESFFAFGVDLRTIRPTTLEGKRRTRAQLEQIAKLQSEGDTYIT